MTAFVASQGVRFADCDPAGIVFFPQYLVMLNTLVERWFDEGLQVLVCTSLDTHRPQPLPDDVRQALAPYLEKSP